MTQRAQRIDLELIVVSPETPDSAKAEVIPLIEAALREEGKEDLLREGDIKVEVGQTFPDALVVPIIIYLVSPIAVETYKRVILPYLQQRFGIGRETERSQEPDKL